MKANAYTNSDINGFAGTIPAGVNPVARLTYTLGTTEKRFLWRTPRIR